MTFYLLNIQKRMQAPNQFFTENFDINRTWFPWPLTWCVFVSSKKQVVAGNLRHTREIICFCK